MSCGTPLCFLKPLLLVAAVAAVGMGGYNFARTGCPLGGCPDATQTTNVSQVSVDGAAKSGCPKGGCGESTGADGSLLLAATSSSPRDAHEGECAGMEASHCSGAAQLVSDGKAACPVSAEACAGMDPAICEQLCEAECPHAEPAVEQVAEGAAQAAGGAGEG